MGLIPGSFTGSLRRSDDVRVTAQPDRAPEGFHTPGMGILVDVRTLVLGFGYPQADEILYTLLINSASD